MLRTDKFYSHTNIYAYSNALTYILKYTNTRTNT